MLPNVDYEVIFSPRRRSLGITVERDGRIIVRAPEGTSRAVVQNVIESRARWIRDKVTHPQKYRPVASPGKELASGESMLYLGQEYRVEIVESELHQIKFDEGFFVPEFLGNKGREAFAEWYWEAAQRELLPRLEIWAAKLGTQPTQTRITNDKYRWGSCSPRGSIGLNWRLVKAPRLVSDYVVVHELAHMLEPSHNASFWSIVRAHLTGVEMSRRWLREQGHLLVQDL